VKDKTADEKPALKHKTGLVEKGLIWIRKITNDDEKK
jgi:hypothetical protein